MVTIDLSQSSITDANLKIRACGQQGQDVEIINPDARHNIGVGLVDRLRYALKALRDIFVADCLTARITRLSTMRAGR